MTPSDDTNIIALPARGRITLAGPDMLSFLQPLITQDVEGLSPGELRYSALLTPQGKYLHDFFIYMEEEDRTLRIDCEGGERAQELAKRLKFYRMRKKVTIDVDEDTPVLAGFDRTPPAAAMADPRHVEMGWRLYESDDMRHQAVGAFETWDRRRINLAIPDGSRDGEIERSTLADLNIDQLHAVAWTKGCYVGQELTARMKYKGLAKKRLIPVAPATGDPLPENGAKIEADGRAVGEMRSACGDTGLALLRLDRLDRLAGAGLKQTGTGPEL